MDLLLLLFVVFMFIIILVTTWNLYSDDTEWCTPPQLKAAGISYALFVFSIMMLISFIYFVPVSIFVNMSNGTVVDRVERTMLQQITFYNPTCVVTVSSDQRYSIVVDQINELIINHPCDSLTDHDTIRIQQHIDSITNTYFNARVGNI
jgi:hypothetical protein